MLQIILSFSNVVSRRCMYSDKHFGDVFAQITGKKRSISKL